MYNCCYLNIDKKSLHDFWMENYNTFMGNKKDSFFKFCYDKIGYQTEKVTLSKPKELDGILDEKMKFEKKIQGFTGAITLPVKKEWIKCQKSWQEKKQSGIEFTEFLRDYFLHSNNNNINHQKTRKKFSLSVLTNQGKLLLKRRSWDGRYVYQIVNDSDSRTSSDNKPTIPVRTENGKIGRRLARWARSKNIVKLKPSNEKYQEGEEINPNSWWLIDQEKANLSLPDGIDKIWYRIDDNTAYTVKLRLNKDGKELFFNITR